MKWLIIFLFLVPCVYAYDCSKFSGLNYNNCLTLNSMNESLIANLIYTSHFIADHSFVRDYNDQIIVTTNLTPTMTGNYIKDAWISILTVSPSIVLNDSMYVNGVFTVRTEYNYRIQIPAQYNDNTKRNGRTCKIVYSLSSQSSTPIISLGSVINSGSKSASFVIFNPATITASVRITTTIKSDNYVWRIPRRSWICTYTSTGYSSEAITPTNSIIIKAWQTLPVTTAQIGESYLDTQKIVVNDSGRNFILNTSNASLVKQSQYISARFFKSPYNFIQLYGQETNESKSSNIVASTQIAVPKTNTCSVTSYDYFTSDSQECLKANISLNAIKTDSAPKNNWYPLYLLIILGLVCFFLYRILKATWGKYFLPIFIVILLIPSAFASECGLTNIGSCIPEAIFNFITGIINAPLEPLLGAINYFLTQPVSIDLFFSIWQIVIYILSFFYLIMLSFAGFKFLTSGHDIMKREQAKEWLQNAVLAIVFTTASFYIYQLVIEASASVTQGLLAMVPDTFFKITVDNISNVALEFFYSFSYLMVLLVTVLIFCLRYILVAISIVFVPFGVFCYYVPPLKSYGNLILQLIGILNAIPIFCGLIALACSKMINISFFANTKILLMISAFSLMDIIVLMGLWHIVNASGLKGVVDKTISAGKYIAALVA